MKRIVLVSYLDNYYYPTIDIKLAKWIKEQHKKYIDIIDSETNICKSVPFDIYGVLDRDIMVDINKEHIIANINSSNLFKMRDTTKVIFTTAKIDGTDVIHVGIYDDDKHLMSKIIPIWDIYSFVYNNE